MPDEAQPMPKLPEPFHKEASAFGWPDLYTAAQMHAFRAEGVKEATAGYAELLKAASNYANRYALDEADDDGPHFTGCSQQQHEDAKRLLAAIRSLAGKEGA